MKVEHTVKIAAPAKDVYDVVMSPAQLEDWVTIHHHLEGSPPARLEEGSKLTQCLKLAGKKFKVHWTVMENDPCERVVWEGRGPVASRARVEYRFAPNGDEHHLLLPQRVRPARRPARPLRRQGRLACDTKGAGGFLAAPQVTSRVTVNG